MPRSVRERRTQELRVLLPASLKLKAKTRAQREGTSLSSLMMRALEIYLTSTSENPLSSLAGTWQNESENLTEMIKKSRRSRHSSRNSDIEW